MPPDVEVDGSDFIDADTNEWQIIGTRFTRTAGDYSLYVREIILDGQLKPACEEIWCSGPAVNVALVEVDPNNFQVVDVIKCIKATTVTSNHRTFIPVLKPGQFEIPAGNGTYEIRASVTRWRPNPLLPDPVGPEDNELEGATPVIGATANGNLTTQTLVADEELPGSPITIRFSMGD